MIRCDFNLIKQSIFSFNQLFKARAGQLFLDSVKGRAGELRDGMKIVMVGFGAGLTYAGTYCTWPNL